MKIAKYKTTLALKTLATITITLILALVVPMVPMVVMVEMASNKIPYYMVNELMNSS